MSQTSVMIDPVTATEIQPLSSDEIQPQQQIIVNRKSKQSSSDTKHGSFFILSQSL